MREITAGSLREACSEVRGLALGSDYEWRWLHGPRLSELTHACHKAQETAAVAAELLNLIADRKERRQTWEAAQPPVQPIEQPPHITVRDSNGTTHLIPNPMHKPKPGEVPVLTAEERELLARLSKRHGWAPQEAA